MGCNRRTIFKQQVRFHFMYADIVFESPLRRWLTGGILIALAFNALVLVAFVWSKGGQTTVVEVQNLGGAYRALTDGIVVTPDPRHGSDRVALDVPDSGSIVIVLPPAVDSLPRPAGIDRVEVLDADGNILFEDDFERLDLETWSIVSGDFEIKNGVLSALYTGEPNSLHLRSPGWSDYSVQVTYRNGQSGVIGTYLASGGGLYYHFNLVRDFPNFFSPVFEGETGTSVHGSLMRSSHEGPIRSFLAMATGPYPYVVAGIAAAILLTLGLSRVGARLVPRLTPRLETLNALPWQIGLLALMVLGTLVVTAGLHYAYYEAIPHLPDEVSYLFQAHLLTQLRVTGDLPPVSEAFQFYDPHFLYVRDDQWASFYPFGHPLVLAIGYVFGVVNLVPSIVGAACVVLLYGVGRRLYDGNTAILAALLLVVSPFFLMQASSFMSHNTGVLYILLSLFFILKRDKPLLYGFIAGVAFGLGVNTRPLPMVALMLPFGGLLLSYLVTRAEDLRTWLKHAVPFVAGGMVMMAALLAYNYGVTGEAFASTYTGADGGSSDLFGFGNGHSLDIGLRNSAAQLMALLLTFNAWPVFIGVFLIGLPFLFGSRNVWDYFLAACAILPMLIHVGYRYSGIYEGPRYWYEAMPFLVLLSARGAVMATAFIASAAAWLQTRLRWQSVPTSWAAHLTVYSVIFVLIVWGSGGWLFGWAKPQESPLIPYEAAGKERLFGVDARLDRLADEVELENALVLVEPCGFFRSSACYGSVFLRNLPDFDGDVVWARYMPDRLDDLRAAFPGRDLYIATWDPEASIQPYIPE